MAQDTTLHVKVEPDLAAHLRELARKGLTFCVGPEPEYFYFKGAEAPLPLELKSRTRSLNRDTLPLCVAKSRRMELAMSSSSRAILLARLTSRRACSITFSISG